MIPNTHLKEFSALLAQLKVREADLEQRMAAAFEEKFGCFSPRGFPPPAVLGNTFQTIQGLCLRANRQS
jgi:hypothetical protein